MVYSVHLIGLFNTATDFYHGTALKAPYHGQLQEKNILLFCTTMCRTAIRDPQNILSDRMMIRKLRFNFYREGPGCLPWFREIMGSYVVVKDS